MRDGRNGRGRNPVLYDALIVGEALGEVEYLPFGQAVAGANRNGAAGPEAKDESRERRFFQDEPAVVMDERANGEEREHGDAERISGERIMKERAEHRQGGDRAEVTIESGVNHEAREQIDLRAGHEAKALDGGLEEHHEERDEQEQSCLEPGHTISTKHQ